MDSYNDIELNDFDKDVMWRYKVRFGFFYEHNGGAECPICSNKNIAQYIAPFIVSKVPYSVIIQLLDKKFQMVLTEDDIMFHRPHIKVIADKDGRMRERFMNDMEEIQSEISADISVESVINSSLRSLQAEKLRRERFSQTNEPEYLRIMDQLGKWADLKLKLDSKKTSQETDKVSIHDLIRVNNDE